MDIKQVPAHKNNYTARNSKKVGVVMHWIVGEISAADATFRNPTRRASAHFGVGSNGEIHQYVNDNHIAWHASNWDANTKYIGIEHAGGQLKNGSRKKPTEKCHQASAELIAHLAEKHGFKPQVGKSVFPHNKFSATQCPGSLDINKIINKANSILSNSNKPMDYKLYKVHNNLYADITSGGFVGKIKVERLDGAEKGKYIEGININRPNGGKGGALVKDMDKIRYKVIFPNNHKIYDNRTKQASKPAPKPTPPQDNKEAEKAVAAINRINKYAKVENGDPEKIAIVAVDAIRKAPTLELDLKRALESENDLKKQVASLAQSLDSQKAHINSLNKKIEELRETSDVALFNRLGKLISQIFNRGVRK